MKRVLLVAYYFPPMGSSGVQRPLKFAKYLAEHGWEPIVLTPEPGAYHTFDPSLLEELKDRRVTIKRVSANTPFHVAGSAPLKVDFIPEPFAKMLRWLSRLFWLPDNKTGWIQPAYEKALQIYQETPYDAIFSTAAPYSNLILARRLKKSLQLPTIMDLRDEWLDSHLITYPTPWHKRKMARIEQETLSSADLVTVINKAVGSSIEARIPSVSTHLLRQGFDPEDFQQEPDRRDPDICIILYSGIFYGQRNPLSFFKAVADLLDRRPELRNSIRLTFQGGLEDRYLNRAEELGIRELVKDLGYLAHQEAVQNLLTADLMWLVVGHRRHADRVTVGKLFEYFGAGKPILGLMPQGAGRELLKLYGAGYLANPEDTHQISIQLEQFLDQWQSGNLPKPDPVFIQKYDRKAIAGELAQLLNQLSAF